MITCMKELPSISWPLVLVRDHQVGQLVLGTKNFARPKRSVPRILPVQYGWNKQLRVCQIVAIFAVDVQSAG